MSNDQQLHGVGGWLAFFMFFFMVIGPVSSFGSASVELNAAIEQYPHLKTDTRWAAYTTSTWLIISVAAALRLVAGFCLLTRRTWRSVLFTIAVLWVTSIGVLFVDWALASFLFGPVQTDQVGELAGRLLAAFITASVWTAYLLRSKRVRNTYREGAPVAAPVITSPQSPRLGRAKDRFRVVLILAYQLGALATFGKLTFLDGYAYTWWNWIFVVPLNMFLSQLWPVYWLVVRPLFH